jgi:hypothetical protein
MEPLTLDPSPHPMGRGKASTSLADRNVGVTEGSQSQRDRRYPGGNPNFR